MKKWLKLIAFLAISNQLLAQQSFTIDDALKYAAEHNVNVQKTKIDQTIADQKVKETIGIGLPQINGQAKYTDYLNIPVSLLPAKLQDRNAPDDLFFPVSFGQKYNGSIGATISQLLFNGSYIVGLESSRTYKETASLVAEKTQISVKEGIILSYAAVLATDENIKTLEENRKTLNKTLEDTKVVYKTGLTEFQNVEQLEYNYKNLVTVIENLKRTRKKLESSLKYLMGYPLQDNINLVSTLEEAIQKNQTVISTDDYDFSSHIDLKLKKNQIRINELLLKLEKSKALPSLSTFFSTQSSAQNSYFKIFSSNQRWYNTTLWGIQLDVPIFSGLQRHWKTQQAKLNLQKAQLDFDDAKKSLQNNASSASIDYENALASFNNAKDLIDLSSSIYKKQQIKFKEGMGTSFELSQAESQLYDAQTKYYQAALNLIQAKTKLDEALGKL